MVEQLPFKQLVAGSSPAGSTKIFKKPLVLTNGFFMLFDFLLDYAIIFLAHNNQLFLKGDYHGQTIFGPGDFSSPRTNRVH